MPRTTASQAATVHRLPPNGRRQKSAAAPARMPAASPSPGISGNPGHATIQTTISDPDTAATSVAETASGHGVQPNRRRECIARSLSRLPRGAGVRS